MANPPSNGACKFCEEDHTSCLPGFKINAWDTYIWSILLTPESSTQNPVRIVSSMQVESAISVQKLKPTIDAIKRQYGEDKEKIQRETSALYEKAGVNPLAGNAAGKE